jgi:hypothetical protein
MWFKVLQTCEKGSLDWAEVPASGTLNQRPEVPLLPCWRSLVRVLRGISIEPLDRRRAFMNSLFHRIAPTHAFGRHCGDGFRAWRSPSCAIRSQNPLVFFNPVKETS